MLSSHVVVLQASYDNAKRAVTVESHMVVSIDEVDEIARRAQPSMGNLMTASEHNVSLRQLLFTIHYLALRVNCSAWSCSHFSSPSGTMTRYMPLGSEPGREEFVESLRREPCTTPVDEILHCLNMGLAGFGSCGSKADKVSAAAVAAEIAHNRGKVASNTARIAQIRAALSSVLTELLMATVASQQTFEPA